MKPAEFDAAAIGAYAVNVPNHRGSVCVELNDGEASVLVYMNPEEAIKFAQDILHEAALAEVWAAA